MVLFYVCVLSDLARPARSNPDHRSQGLPIGWVAIMLALLASMGGFIFGVSWLALQ